VNQEEAIQKAKAKRGFKIRGKVLEVQKLYDTFYTVVLYKGAGKNKKFFPINFYGKELCEIAKKLEKNNRLKIRFDIICKHYPQGNKYISYLNAFEVSEWLVNEDKIKRTEYQQELFEEKMKEKNNNKKLEQENNFEAPEYI